MARLQEVASKKIVCMIQNLGLLVAFILGIASKTLGKHMARHSARASQRLSEAHQSSGILRPQLSSKTVPAASEHQAWPVPTTDQSFLCGEGTRAEERNHFKSLDTDAFGQRIIHRQVV
jgi:hypothetical protein